MFYGIMIFVVIDDIFFCLNNVLVMIQVALSLTTMMTSQNVATLGRSEALRCSFFLSFFSLSQ